MLFSLVRFQIVPFRIVQTWHATPEHERIQVRRIGGRGTQRLDLDAERLREGETSRQENQETARAQAEATNLFRFLWARTPRTGHQTCNRPRSLARHDGKHFLGRPLRKASWMSQKKCDTTTTGWNQFRCQSRVKRHRPQSRLQNICGPTRQQNHRVSLRRRLRRLPPRGRHRLSTQASRTRSRLSNFGGSHVTTEPSYFTAAKAQPCRRAMTRGQDGDHVSVRQHFERASSGVRDSSAGR